MVKTTNLEKRLAALEQSAHDEDAGPVASMTWWRSLMAGEIPSDLGGPLGAVLATINKRRAQAVATLIEFKEGDQE